MDAWELAGVQAAQAASGRRYHEFLRVPDLSAGLYVLEAGDADPQSPHTEDELYYVVSGRARIRSATTTEPSSPVRSCSLARPSRIGSTTSPSGWAARRVRPAEGVRA